MVRHLQCRRNRKVDLYASSNLLKQWDQSQAGLHSSSLKDLGSGSAHPFDRCLDYGELYCRDCFRECLRDDPDLRYEPYKK